MALTGRFEADFSPFVKEANEGTDALKRFETQSGATEKAAEDMLLGITDDAKKAETQLKLVKGAAVDAAAAQAKVAANAEEQGSKATKALTGAAGAATSFAQAAEKLGIDLGPVSTAIEQFSGVTSQLETMAAVMSPLGVAAGVVGSAILGWKIGTKIDEATHLSDKIEDIARRWMGVETIADRIANGPSAELVAQREAEAQAIIDENTATSDANALYDKQLHAHENILKAQQAKQAAIDQEETALKSQEGIWNDLLADIKAGVTSAKDLADNYGVSLDTLKQIEHEQNIIANNAKQLQKLQDQLDKNAKKRADDQAAADAKHLSDLNAQIDKDTKAADADKAKRDDALDQQLAADKAKRDAAQDLINQQFDAAQHTASGVSASTSVTAANLAQMLSSLGLSVTGGTALAQKGYSFGEIVSILRGGPQGAPMGPGIPGVTAPAAPATSAAPVAQTIIHAPITVSGVFDPQSSAALGKAVSGALATSLSGKRMLIGKWS